jgi:thiamine-phosphate diphosphorylase/hydroxyethylthiazole kinase
LHQITQKYGVPLIINDRVDVALAVGAEGVHVGQDDMDLQTVRRLLPDAIVGVSVSTAEEALLAIHHGATYLGIGVVFTTST